MASDNVSEIYKRCQVGIQLLWNNKFDEAEAYFAQEKDKHPRFALHYAEVSIYRTVITELTTERDEAIKRMNQVIQFAEKQIKYYEQSPQIEDRDNLSLDAKVIYADAHTMLAILLILEEARVKGILTLRKGWKLYKQALGLVSPSSSPSNNPPKTYSPCVLSSLKFGAGLFYFILSFIPPGVLQKAASLAGFSGGNKDLGLQYLVEARNTSDSVRADMASMILGLNLLLATVAPDDDSIMELFHKSQDFIRSGLSQYESGCAFQAVAALGFLEANMTSEATSNTQKAITNCQQLTNYPAVFLRLLTNCYEMEYNWEDLCTSLQKIVDLAAEGEKKGQFKNPWTLTWNSIRLGSVLILNGQVERGRKLFKEVASAKKVDMWSEVVIFLANKYQKTGGYFSALELMALTQHFEKSLKFSTPEKRQTMLDLIESLAKQADGALTPMPSTPSRSSSFLKLDNIFKSKHNDPKIDNRVSYLTLKGIVLKYHDQEAEALKYFQEVIDNQTRLVDKLHYAISLVQVAKFHMKTNPPEAMRLLALVMPLDFTFDSAFKSQSRAYMTYLSQKNSLASPVVDETPLSPIIDEEEEDEKAEAKLEKMLNEEI